MDYQEGQTATNPKTGQKVVFRGGQWVNAGQSAQPTVMGDRARLELQSAGMPVLRTIADPFSRMRDPKQQNMARTQMMTAGQKQLAKESEGMSSVSEDLRNIDEFQSINKRIQTGDWGSTIGKYLPGPLQSLVAPDVQRMEQIGLGLARGQRKAGEGTISDYDAKMFQKMVGGADKTPKNNDAYANAFRSVRQAAQEKEAFREAFLQANGTLIGADRMWMQYSKSNPLFDKSGTTRQRKGWADYFSGRAQGRLKPPAPKASQNAGGWKIERADD